MLFLRAAETPACPYEKCSVGIARVNAAGWFFLQERTAFPGFGNDTATLSRLEDIARDEQ